MSLSQSTLLHRSVPHGITVRALKELLNQSGKKNRMPKHKGRAEVGPFNFVAGTRPDNKKTLLVKKNNGISHK